MLFRNHILMFTKVLLSQSMFAHKRLILYNIKIKHICPIFEVKNWGTSKIWQILSLLKLILKNLEKKSNIWFCNVFAFWPWQDLREKNRVAMDALSKTEKMAEGASDLKATVASKDLQIATLNDNLKKAHKEKHVRSSSILSMLSSLCFQTSVL